jgi:Ca2+-binding RTX toxin-like protein
MRGKLVAGAIVLAAVAVCVPGTAGARGGNEDCLPGDRHVFAGHFFASGDNVVAGYFTEEIKFPSSTSETVVIENGASDGSGPSTHACGADQFFWSLFRANLGPGDDSVRLDAAGLQSKYVVVPRALPKRIASLLSGGPGNDVLRGHDGFDDMSGGGGGDVLTPLGGRDRARAGAGADLIRAADGRKDNVACGPGRDKAIVDSHDDVRGCERVVRRRG